MVQFHSLRLELRPMAGHLSYAHFFEIVEIAGRRRITKESFQKFLNGQDQYAPVGNLNRHDSSEGPEKQADREELSDIQKKTSPSVYLTAAEAASLANMSRQAITRHVDRGCFGDARHRNMIRIRRDAFEEWMSKRQQEVVQEWRQLQKETEDSV